MKISWLKKILPELNSLVSKVAYSYECNAQKLFDH